MEIFVKSLTRIVLLSSLVFSTLAAKGPKIIVEEIFKHAKDPKIATDKGLQGKVNAMINFDQMAISSLGKYHKQISKSDLAWYSETIKSIITETVYPDAPDFFKGVQISYEDEEVGGDSALIVSVVTEKGEETQVDYKLKKIKGVWRVVDVALDEESWIESIYDQVDEVMKKDKWPGLKKKLTDRLKKIRQDNKKS
jgi:ABC-type transporter MlaC component